MLAGKEIVRAGYGKKKKRKRNCKNWFVNKKGKGIVRAGYGNKMAF